MLRKDYLLSLFVVWSFVIGSVHGGVVGSDTQNFNPTSDGDEFITTKSTKVLGHLNFNVGLFLDHAINPLPYYEDTNAEDFQSRSSLNDHLTSLDLHFAIGLSKFMNLGININSLLSQGVEEDRARAQFAKKGFTGIRGNLKFNIIEKQSFGLGVDVSANYNQVENNPFTGEGADATFHLQLLLDFALSSSSKLALNFGYRGRDNGSNLDDFPRIETINNQLIFDIGFRHKFSHSFRMIAEIYGAAPLKSGDFESERKVQSAELILALRKDFMRSLNLKTYFGVGTELMHGLFTPDWRAFLGLNYTVNWDANRSQSVRRAPLVINRAPAYIPPPTRSRPAAVITIKDVVFKLNSDQILLGKAYRDLNRVANKVKSISNFTRLEIGGHTCNLGSDAYNQNLSQRRAATIMRTLVTKFGLPSSKIRIRGYGESRPIADNRTESGRKNNRRVEFKIYGN